MLSALLQMWSNGFDMFDILFLLGSYAVVLFLMLPVHECAHGFVADKLGDPTARYSGRLTLNPMKHFDPIGTTMMLLFGIGYARPVPVNPFNFRKPKRDMALTALAGPVSNLLMAILSVAIFRVLILLSGTNVQVIDGMIYYSDKWFYYAYLVLIEVLASVNISLAVFNLLPIPPLDGSRIFSAILPDKWSYTLQRYEHYIFIGLMALLFTGVLNIPLAALRRGFGFVICTVFGMPNLF